MISAFSTRPLVPASWILAAFSMLALSALSCDTPAKTPEPRADQLAKSFCACSNQLLLLNQAHATKSDSLSFREIFLEFEKSKTCIAALGIKSEDRPSFEASLLTHCPNLAAEKDLIRELLGE